ncbi:glycosyltransferase family 2 protein [Williamsia maris]|uniref:Glycosyl transferase family 2 n=1 Tax=Williamsia maris TaxID=72806 RepID=A0ABT1HIR5_9NOCA|nr:glycosyltransferase family A protein [Williamsia maris]MCP2177831.1 Glycosyl transferase family 2 [Williamsia maris]
MTTISVIIPTVGRTSLDAAIASALDQSHPVTEVLVMVDVAEPISIGVQDHRVRCIEVGDHIGGAAARQRGVDAAVGDVIALLDDDDLWHPYKLERQLRFAGRIARGHPWIASSRAAVRAPGRRDRVIPRRLIEPREPVLDYLFEVTVPRAGNAMLQTSTLCFPREIAVQVPLDADREAVHDEPTWLHHVQHVFPGLLFCHVPDCLTVYNVTAGSVSNTTVDDSARYIRWGQTYLGDATARARGDYFLTSATSAAAKAHSPRGVVNAVRAGFEFGRPGPSAVVYAGAKLVKAMLPAGSDPSSSDRGRR